MAQGQLEIPGAVDQAAARTRVAARTADHVARIVFFICAVLIIAIIASVLVFITINGVRIFFEKGGTTLSRFFAGMTWDPNGGSHADAEGNPIPEFGAAGLIIGSIVTTLLSVIIATPLAVGLAIYFTEAAPRWLTRLLQPLIELFTGMPSVVIGFLGLVVLVPWLQKLASPITGGLPLGGYGWGAAILVLVVMILPTIISVSIDSLRAVPLSVREASLALGSTRWQMMSRAIIPAASTGLATGVVLGMARAIGETLAVTMVLGGADIPKDLFTLKVFFMPNVNMTQKIALDFGESLGVARDAYWTLALVLLVISFLFICISRYLASRSVYK
ncbi:MAG: phosphate ABC transporter permease subunit PstC [Ktedonobacteraceae bacterium]|nr:phosphate ABC transporter permease subunit PstC [Ktedonobacteraceae bacterium]